MGYRMCAGTNNRSKIRFSPNKFVLRSEGKYKQGKLGGSFIYIISISTRIKFSLEKKWVGEHNK